MAKNACDAGDAENQLIGQVWIIVDEFLGKVAGTLDTLSERLRDRDTQTAARQGDKVIR